MGNSASSKVVSVVLDQKAHESGSSVSGNVHVDIDEFESPSDVAALYIMVSSKSLIQSMWYASY